ncbi:MAG: histidine kinase [Flavobacteriales bacterium]|nr:MAG: histidine kinase [Flavobacteriales bacterium]
MLQNTNDCVQANERGLASSFLTGFARLMRAVLEHTRKDEVSLAEDLSVLRDYLDLERLRSGARFEYRLEVGSDIDPEDLMVTPMLLQPYAEQAIWNSLGRTDDPGHLVIRVQRSQGTLVLLLEDDLQSGATDPSIASDRSEGTVITEARLALLAKQGKRQASVKVIPMPVGRRVELTLPLSEAA